MGSGAVAPVGACQKRASVVQRAIMLAPLAAATARLSPSATHLMAVSTGNFTRRRLMRIVPSIIAATRAGISANATPKSTRNVTKANAPNVAAWMSTLVQNTAL